MIMCVVRMMIIEEEVSLIFFVKYFLQPVIPPIPTRHKRKRTTSVEMPNSPLMIKRMKVDATHSVGVPVNNICSNNMIDPATMQGKC